MTQYNADCISAYANLIKLVWRTKKSIRKKLMLQVKAGGTRMERLFLFFFLILRGDRINVIFQGYLR